MITLRAFEVTNPGYGLQTFAKLQGEPAHCRHHVPGEYISEGKCAPQEHDGGLQKLAVHFKRRAHIVLDLALDHPGQNSVGIICKLTHRSCFATSLGAFDLHLLPCGLYVMVPRSGTECHREWQTASHYVSQFHPRPSREETSTKASSPWDPIQQLPKEANPRRVSPEPQPPPKSWNENAQEVQSKQSRHLEDEEQRTSVESAHDRNSNTDIVDKRVNGQIITHDRICKIDIPEHRKPLLEREAECEKVRDYSFPWRSLLESFLRLLESFLRLLESIRRLSDYFLLWVPRKGGRKKAKGEDWESLPGDLQENIFQWLSFKDLTLAKAVSKSWKNLIERNIFRRSRGLSGEGAFTALNFDIKYGEWQCTGYDLHSGKWQRLPTFRWLPRPDPNLFKEYSICGQGGFMCVNVSKSSRKEELVVFNILTGEKKELPPLHYARNSVLLHIWVNIATGSYKVIAAGSASSSGEKDLSRRIEVYDSRTSKWEIGSDIPGPEFGLNEYQVGVCVNGVLYFVMFLEGDGQKGIVAFDIEKGEWLEDRTCAVPFSLFCNTLQLLESSGMLYLFSEQERDGVVEHCIDVVELWKSDVGEELWQLRTVVRVKISGGRGLLVYPEYTCVPFGDGKLCVFNTINRDGVVYDIENGIQSEILQPPPENQRGENFFCLNPVSFTIAPNFACKP